MGIDPIRFFKFFWMQACKQIFLTDKLSTKKVSTMPGKTSTPIEYLI